MKRPRNGVIPDQARGWHLIEYLSKGRRGHEAKLGTDLEPERPDRKNATPRTDDSGRQGGGMRVPD